MKKNKLLKIICSLALCFTICFAFMGCDVNEVKNATTAGIEASTNIIPVVYDEDTSRNTFATALNNSLQQEGYKNTCSTCNYNNETSSSSGGAIMVCARKDGVVSYRFSTNSSMGEQVAYFTKIGNDYYYLGPNYTDKVYKKTDSLGFASEFNRLALPMYSSFIPSVVNGKYYKGAEYVYASVSEDGTTSLYEFVIKNNLIVQINITSYKYVDATNYRFNSITMDFEYGSQVIADLPTSLEGYTNLDA